MHICPLSCLCPLSLPVLGAGSAGQPELPPKLRIPHTDPVLIRCVMTAWGGCMSLCAGSVAFWREFGARFVRFVGGRPGRACVRRACVHQSVLVRAVGARAGAECGCSRCGPGRLGQGLIILYMEG